MSLSQEVNKSSKQNHNRRVMLLLYPPSHDSSCTSHAMTPQGVVHPRAGIEPAKGKPLVHLPQTGLKRSKSGA
jgi:hypothetical protein